MGAQKRLIESLQRQLLQMQQSALTNAQTEDPALTRLRGDATGYLDWIKKGDYRNPEKGTFFNMTPLAERNKDRDLNFNAGALGQTALAGGSGEGRGALDGLLKLDKANRADEMSRDYADEFQGNIAQGTANAKNALLGIGQQGDQRNQNFLQGWSSLYNTASQQKKPQNIWGTLAQMGMNALPSIISAI